MAQNINPLLLQHGYSDLVIVAIGTNDKYTNDTSPLSGEETTRYLIETIEVIRNLNPDADIVFSLSSRKYELKAMEGESGGEISPYIDALIQVCKEYDLAIIDPMATMFNACVEVSGSVDSAWTDGWAAYYLDGGKDEVHPNARGMEIYGETVWSYINAALK